VGSWDGSCPDWVWTFRTAEASDNDRQLLDCGASAEDAAAVAAAAAAA